MKNSKVPWVLAVLPLLSACSISQTVFFRPSTDEATVTRNLAECQVEADKLFPSARIPVGGTWGPYGGPYGYGRPWVWGYSTVQTRDDNLPARNKHRLDCMVAQGYNPVDIPFCTPEQIGSNKFAALTPAAKPTPTLCATRVNQQTVVIDLAKPLPKAD